MFLCAASGFQVTYLNATQNSACPPNSTGFAQLMCSNFSKDIDFKKKAFHIY